MSQTAPIKVCTLDLERLPTEVSTRHPEGGRYRGLWLLVRGNGRPLQMLRLTPTGRDAEGIDRERLRLHIERAGVDVRDIAPGVQAPERAKAPRISVIVPSTLARREGLCRCLESLEALDYPDAELLLVDNRRDGDGRHPQWLERFPAVRVLHERRPGISAARNRGLGEAGGELVAFTDDDVTVDPGWLSALAARFAARPEEACVTGLVIPAELETPAQVMLERYYEGGGYGPTIFKPVSHRLLPCPDGVARGHRGMVGQFDDDDRLLRDFSLYAAGTFGAGANMAFRTAALRAVGGFDESLGAGMPSCGGEDLGMFVQLAWRGHSVGFEPAALVHHTHRRDDSALRKHIEGYGVGFSALMVALVDYDRRHLEAMLAILPRGVRSLLGTYARKLRGRSGQTGIAEGASAASENGAAGHGAAAAATDGGTPNDEHRRAMSRLARLELRGMARGPAAYRSSRRLVRERR